jgi:hypothetical protein
MNAGVVLWCRTRRFLGARVHLDEERLAALDPACDPTTVARQLLAIIRVAEGDRSGGPVARLARADRFHWLASPSSTIVQRSEVHTGLTDDPEATLEHLFESLVLPPTA